MQLQVTLDGENVGCWSTAAESLASIRGHLETLALSKRRLLFSMTVDGTPVSLDRPLDGRGSGLTVVARTVGFEQLGFQLISVAEGQCGHLIQRLQNLMLLVLINSWEKGQEGWMRLLPELKDPILTISFIPEAVGFLPGGADISGRAVMRRTDELSAVLVEIERVGLLRDPEEFSSVLESRLLPWLQEFHADLKRFNSPGND